ncbi:MAG: hypothetical protein SFW67_10045 [Myxococcaceae bacterium]|nr:hypothetical protein [Myxococcaceae bacterium]
MQRARLDLTPSNGTARLVVVRPWALKGSIDSFFVIEQGANRVLTEAPNASVSVVELPPGRHRLCVAFPEFLVHGWHYPWSESEFFPAVTPLNDLELEAGTTSFVEVVVHDRFFEVVPARPGSMRLARLMKTVPRLESLAVKADSPLVKPDPAEVARWVEHCQNTTSQERYLLRPPLR